MKAEQAKQPVTAQRTDVKTLERGRYLSQIAGCNDCHTKGYHEAAGNLPEQQWLMGDSLGFRGPWGTTYAPKLRLLVQHLSEDQWVESARLQVLRPPMPWFNLRVTAENDLWALYQFIKHPGPAGHPAPAYLPPGQEPPWPVVQWPEPPK
jgi:mono/diheme cytochrome c family protein